MKLFLLFLFAAAVGCNTREYESALVPSSCFIDPQSWHSPSLTKEELKALDLKLLREAVTFNIGDRVVYLPTNQTAIVLEPFTQIQGNGRQNGLINYEVSRKNDYVSAYDCIKIGEDYVEPCNPAMILWFRYDNLKDCKIDSAYLEFKIRPADIHKPDTCISQGDTVYYFYSKHNLGGKYK